MQYQYEVLENSATGGADWLERALNQLGQQGYQVAGTIDNLVILMRECTDDAIVPPDAEDIPF